MTFDGRTVTLTNGDEATLQLRGDGLYNIHVDGGCTTWGVCPDVIQTLVAGEERALALKIARAAEETFNAARDRAAGGMFVVPTEHCDYDTHVRQTTSIRIVVECDEYGLEQFAEWYAMQTGETITGDEPWLRVVDRKGGWEPRIRCTYTHGMALPHPVIDAGTVGKGNKSADGQPRFLLFQQRAELENNYISYFAGLLKQGWRP